VPHGGADYVDQHDIGLVVMTTHARTGLKRWVLGSVADRLLRRVSIRSCCCIPRTCRSQPGSAGS
jgi:hypothetical protein